MKHVLILLSALLLIHIPIHSQKDLGDCYNLFNRTQNRDTAILCIKELSKNADILNDLIHNSFFQKFKHGEAKDFDYEIVNELAKIPETNIKNSIAPLYAWLQIENNKDSREQKKSVQKFIDTQINAKDSIYKNKTARYALLIWQDISQKPELKTIADKLFDITYNRLKSEQITLNTNRPERKQSKIRAFYRYLYAYCNFIKATEKEIQPDKAQSFFEIAYQYSPDANDLNVRYAYYYEAAFLNNKKESFQEDYLYFLKEHSHDNEKIVAVLLPMALKDPVNYKEKLKETYNSLSKPVKFSDYWINEINNSAMDLPDLTFTFSDGSKISRDNNKWIFLDFWGTWCGPCRAEHPELENFYREISENEHNKITLQTIACYCKKKEVRKYMQEKEYTFPVTMADDNIMPALGIKSWPSKLLITPQGKYLRIPFGVSDWKGTILKYTEE